MKIKVECLIDFEDGEMGGCEYMEFKDRRIELFENLINEYFDLKTQPFIEITDL